MDWSALLQKAALIVAGGVCTWAATGGRRAIRNLGKTEVELADEELERAMSRAERAHKNDDPTDDAAADAAVEKARAFRARARRMNAIADAFGAEK